jgi:FKBP-type peptidyl-prolyl cis-trans isomerase
VTTTIATALSALLLGGVIAAPPDLKAPPADAERSQDGLTSKVLRRGAGKEHPTLADAVELQYTGWTADGTMFDHSSDHGAPARFPLRTVIEGWSRGIPSMVVGEKRRFWIPAALGYGDSPPRAGLPAGPLVYDVELVAILKAPKAPPAPPDVKAPPLGARRTASGLAFRVLKKGSGKVHPNEEAIVVVHYTGWTPDGRVVDSSIARGAPTDVQLQKVIPGWTEGLQLMVEGEKRRFWIPPHLAHGGRRPKSAADGSLVFDIELLAIKRNGPNQAGEED